MVGDARLGVLGSYYVLFPCKIPHTPRLLCPDFRNERTIRREDLKGKSAMQSVSI